MEGAAFSSYWNRQLLEMDLPSLYAVFLPKLPFADLQDALYPGMLFHIALLPVKELNSQ